MTYSLLYDYPIIILLLYNPFCSLGEIFFLHCDNKFFNYDKYKY